MVAAHFRYSIIMGVGNLVRIEFVANVSGSYWSRKLIVMHLNLNSAIVSLYR